MNNNNNIKNILIIGNGFDINLGLKTSYADFLNSEQFMNISDKNNLAKFLKKRLEKTRWIDIENELGNYSKSLFILTNGILIPREEKKQEIANFKRDYNEIREALRVYLRIATEKEIININNKKAFEIISNAVRCKDKTYILSFNYTDTIENINDFYFRNNKLIINHIHGRLIDHKIVFGIEDNASVHKDHIFIKKSHNEIQNVSGLNSILEKAENFTFFGYSLGNTDHSYFEKLFVTQVQPNCSKKNFTFYYYGEEAYDDLIYQLDILTHNRYTNLKECNNIKFYNIKQM